MAELYGSGLVMMFLLLGLFVCFWKHVFAVYRNLPAVLGLNRSLQLFRAGGSLTRPVRWGSRPALPARVWLRELRGTGGGKEQ